jgi:hypothetical protein
MPEQGPAPEEPVRQPTVHVTSHVTEIKAGHVWTGDPDKDPGTHGALNLGESWLAFHDPQQAAAAAAALAELARAMEAHTASQSGAPVAEPRRANGPVLLGGAQAEIVLMALSDAKWARVHEGVGCDECEVAEAADRSPDSLPACSRHKPDVERAEVYDQALRWLAEAVGVPEAAAVEVNEDHPSIRRSE